MLPGNFVQRFLHRLDPETAHELALNSLVAAQRLPGGLAFLKARFCDDQPPLRTQALGLEFPNPIGLAAGFVVLAALARLLKILPADDAAWLAQAMGARFEGVLVAIGQRPSAEGGRR